MLAVLGGGNYAVATVANCSKEVMHHTKMRPTFYLFYFYCCD